MLLEVESGSPEETFRLAELIGNRIQPGVIVLLNGELGAGKTVFAKGLGRGLGVMQEITSPSFNLLLRYSGRAVFDHWDLYRVGEIDEDQEFLESIYNGDSVKAIEWGYKLKLKPEGRLMSVELEMLQDDINKRLIRFDTDPDIAREVIKPAVTEWRKR